MQKKVVTITPEATLRSASRIIFGGKNYALPVVDNKGTLIGIVVKKDILRLFFPSVQEYIEDYPHATDFDLMEDKIHEALEIPAKQFMSKNPLTIDSETPLMQAASLMMSKRIGSLPVINDNRKLVGIITHEDIFRTIVRNKIPSLSSHERRGLDFFTRFAKYFDLSFSWSQRLAEEIPFLLKYFKKYKVKAVLDLGCGTGEHTLALAKKGFKVTGVDLNNDMLDYAKEKWKKQDKSVRQNFEFLNIPIREVQSLHGKRYDAAICLGNALPNISNYEKELLGLQETLNPKAIIILQIANYDKIMSEKQRFISFNFSFGETGKEWEKEFAFLRFYNFRPDGDLEFNVETLANDGMLWHSYGVETIVQKPTLKRNISRILNKLGFRNIRFFGDFKEAKYDRDSSQCLIAVATR